MYLPHSSVDSRLISEEKCVVIVCFYAYEILCLSGFRVVVQERSSCSTWLVSDRFFLPLVHLVSEVDSLVVFASTHVAKFCTCTCVVCVARSASFPTNIINSMEQAYRWFGKPFSFFF